MLNYDSSTHRVHIFATAFCKYIYGGPHISCDVYSNLFYYIYGGPNVSCDVYCNLFYYHFRIVFIVIVVFND